jgi:glycosyltransferase involved in cell wall biosynthesis
LNFESGLVSILIPNFNKAEFVKATLESILSQEYQLWECIVVDDHSTDDSWAILKEYEKRDGRFKIVSRPKNISKGANQCRNHAFSLCRGEFIQWFDSDDIMYPWFLSRKVDYLNSFPKMPFVIAKADLKFDSDFVGNKKFAQNLSSENPIEDYLKFKLLFLTGGPLFRRNILKESGLFNIRLSRHQEWELYFRVVLNYTNWGILEEPSFKYFFHSNSITSDFQKKSKVVESELILFQEVLNLPEDKFNNQIPKATRLRIALKYWMVATKYLKARFSVQFLFTLFREVAKA